VTIRQWVQTFLSKSCLYSEKVDVIYHNGVYGVSLRIFTREEEMCLLIFSDDLRPVDVYKDKWMRLFNM
jgi:hypothetical protein